MKTDHDIEQQLQHCRVHADPDTRQRLRDQLYQQWQQHDRHQGHSHSPWLIRLTIAALILLVVSLSLHLLERNTPLGYALDQTATAVQDIQHFHFHSRTQAGDIDREAWIQYDPKGQLSKIRVNFYQRRIVAVWQGGVTQYWLKDSNDLAIFRDQHYTDKMLYFAYRYDPKQAMGYLRGLEAAGDVHLVYHDRETDLDPITFSVFYEPNTYVLDQPKPTMQERFTVDPQSKWVNQVDVLTWDQAQDDYAHQYTWEYIDYNQPMSAEHFDLLNEVPSDCVLLNTADLELGLQQETLTDQEAASNLVHRFLEAWQKGDLTTALNYGAYLLPQHKQWFEVTLAQYALTDILSISPPQAAEPPQPGFTLDCLVACAHGGPAQTRACTFHVREYAPGQWMISPGFLFRAP